MSTEFDPRSQRYDDGERRADYVPDTAEIIMPDADRAQRALRELAVADTMEPARSRSFMEILTDRQTKIIAGFTATAILSGGFLIGWNSRNGGGGESYPRATATASAPAIPGAESPSPSESPTLDEPTYETTAKYAPTLEQTDLFIALNPEQQAEIRDYAAMPLETFRQLPEEKQLVFGDFYHRATREYGRELLERSPYFHMAAGQVTGKDSAGQSVLDDFAERQGELFYSLATNGNVSNINEANREQAQKALVALYPQLMADSNAYRNRLSQLQSMDSLEGNDVYNPSNGDGYVVRKVVNESPTGRNALGTTTKYINASSSNGEVLQYLYDYTTFTDIYGNEANLWRLKLTVDSDNLMYQPDLTRVYTNHPITY